MGIIRTQSIKNSLTLYLGVVVGAVNTILIFPFVFEEHPEYWGLIQILVSYSIIFSSFSHLGSPNIIIRFFPKIENKGSLLFTNLLLCFFGFLLFLFFFFFFENYFLDKVDATPLLKDYFYLVGFIVFSTTFFDFLTSISRSYLDSSTPVFLNEVFHRLCILLILCLFHYDFLNLPLFLFLYTSIYFLKLLILWVCQLKNNRLSLSFNLSKSEVKQQLRYGMWVLSGGGAAILVSRFDMLMIEHYLDLKQVAYYGLAFFIGSVIKVPSRSVESISSPLIASSFKENDLGNIQTIYSKTSINLLIIGSILFLCISLNINDILSILPEKFSKGRFVIIIIGIAQLINLTAGLHGLILLHSSYYRSIVYFNIFLFAVTFITNVLLIPIYGINGAAMATLISIFLFNTVRMLYVYYQLSMHPFSKKTVMVIISLVVVFVVTYLLPMTSVGLINIFIRCLVSCVLFIISIRILNLSDDINSIINQCIQIVRGNNNT